jgi:nitronate monooxygenase
LENFLSESHRLLEASPSISHGLTQPIGLGIQTFDADIAVASQAIQKYKPSAVWLFAPRDGQLELDVWIASIKKASSETQIWIQVGSVADAIKAAHAPSPPDVLVLQGSDAGGHGLARGAGIISLLPEAVDALRDTNIPLMAAGGIVDGRGFAAALSLGAAGVVMGTRFLASKEAKISKGYQDDVLRTTDGGQNTVRTKLYDELAGRADWPPIYDGRNIVNRSVIDHETGITFAENQKLYKEAMTLGDRGWGPNGRLTAYVGSGVGLISEVAGAADIVKTSREEARASLREASSVL